MRVKRCDSSEPPGAMGNDAGADAPASAADDDTSARGGCPIRGCVSIVEPGVAAAEQDGIMAQQASSQAHGRAVGRGKAKAGG